MLSSIIIGGGGGFYAVSFDVYGAFFFVADWYGADVVVDAGASVADVGDCRLYV